MAVSPAAVILAGIKVAYGRRAAQPFGIGREATVEPEWPTSP